jgi:hypothetical protein
MRSWTISLRPFAPWVTALCTAIGCAIACGGRVTENTTKTSQAVTTGCSGGQCTLVIAVPQGLSPQDVVVEGATTVNVGDGSSVTTDSGSFGTIAELGGATTSVGVTVGLGSKVGNILSQGSVTLHSNAAVNGSIQTGGTVSQHTGVVVTGSITQNRSVSVDSSIQISVTFPSGTQSITLQPGTSQTLAPGSYGNVFVNSGATLSLSAGTYTMTSLDVEAQATLSLDESAGPVIIYIQNTLVYTGTEAQTGGNGNVFLGIFGSQSVELEVPFSGTIVAPNAKLELTSTTTGGLAGAFFGNTVELSPNSTVTGIGAVIPGRVSPTSTTANGPSPATIFNSYVHHQPPPLNATGAAAAAQVAAFIAWAGASKPDEREDGRAVLAGASGNTDVANALISQYRSAVSTDHSLALLVLSLLGELRSPIGEAFLITVTQQALPTTGTLSDGEILERAALEKLQMKAVDGLAYRNTPTSNQEVFRLIGQSTSAPVRAEAIRAYLFNNPSTGRATLSEIVSPSDAIFLDRVEHGPDNLSESSFDTRLAAFLAAHPEVQAPDPQNLSSGTLVFDQQDIAPPSSANPTP